MIEGMRDLFNKLIWKLGQPLTTKPRGEGVPVSDLFLWRNDDLDTVFELLCLPGFFSDLIESETVQVMLFDHNGAQVLTDTIRIKSGQRISLDLEPHTRGYGSYGTMAFFHHGTTEEFRRLKTHLAERGYTAFRLKGNHFKSYVHGNYDAICLAPNGQMQLLGGTSFLRRKYYVQYVFNPHVSYEIALVNPTPKMQKIKLSTFEAKAMSAVESSIQLAPRGSRIIEYTSRPNSWTLVLESRMVMIRPIIFRHDRKKLDVFHG